MKAHTVEFQFYGTGRQTSVKLAREEAHTLFEGIVRTHGLKFIRLRNTQGHIIRHGDDRQEYPVIQPSRVA